MSILLETDSGWVISHPKFFENIKVGPEGGDNSNGEKAPVHHRLKLNPELFDIEKPFRDKICIKGKLVKDLASLNYCETTKLVKALYQSLASHSRYSEVFLRSDTNGVIQVESCKRPAGEEPDLQHGDAERRRECEPEESVRNNVAAVETTRRFFDVVKDLKWPEFRGENPSNEVAVISTVSGCCDCSEEKGDQGKNDPHKFVFPPNSRFYCKDVSEIDQVLGGETFDLLVMDPPWRNKFIRRKKRQQREAGYQLIYDSEIARLPIGNLLNDGGIVAVWCTNARSHQESLKNDIFPKWGLSYHHTFYWLKVTKFGIPICPFNEENKKQPYETVVVGRRVNHSETFPVNAKCHPKLIVSIPSIINSHKPPLVDIFESLFPEQQFRKKCEIFARYLMPGFTSLGNEVVKLQHLSLFVKHEEA